ncbi:universal stress protein [Kitasatospora sp. NBC_01302]|uniref:universal stress protein n=1 Tax=Kitasatospora sp. NBC_01302 TaxID=2903575 RepID=UPI002E163454|nr:universal stress protein [Kitasatospora sp. NBC_01302]
MQSQTRSAVVVGVDPGHPSRLVLAWAADEAHRRDLPLRLVLACRPPTPVSARPLLWAEAEDEARLIRAAGERILGEAARFAAERHPAVVVDTVLVDGEPAEVLRSEEQGAALLVLGSQRLSAVRELFTAGSVAVSLIACAGCPVVVVRDPEHATRQPPYLVVGVDGSPVSQAAVDYAFEAASRRGAGLRAIFGLHTASPDQVDEHRAEQEARRVLAEATAGRAQVYPDVDVTHEVVRGHPVAVLSEASEHALALVVGTRGHGGFTGMLLGSVSQGVLHHARCPVVVVPGPSGDRDRRDGGIVF